jgi:hypothetical protein
MDVAAWRGRSGRGFRRVSRAETRQEPHRARAGAPPQRHASACGGRSRSALPTAGPPHPATLAGSSTPAGARENHSGARRPKPRLTDCDRRVDALYVALLHQHLQRLLAQHLDLVLLQRLAALELLYPAVKLAVARHGRWLLQAARRARAAARPRCPRARAGCGAPALRCSSLAGGRSGVAGGAWFCLPDRGGVANMGGRGHQAGLSAAWWRATRAAACAAACNTP